MTNKEFYEIADRLGMIETDDRVCAVEELDHRTSSEYFEEETSKDLVSVMNFVDELFTNNDTETIKKLLIAVIYNNKEGK